MAFGVPMTAAPPEVDPQPRMRLAPEALWLHLVTDPVLCGPRGVVQTAVDAVDGGATLCQVRDKAASDAELLRTVVAVARAVGDRVPVLVDDRVDVFLAARALGAPVAGVHVGQSDLPVAVVREIVGDEAVIGLTANRPEHFAAAADLPAGTVDYLGTGVIHPTTTKANHPAVLGVAGFSALATPTSVPCVAIGGISVDDVAGLRSGGAAGVAVVSAICAADDARAAAHDLRQRWGRA